ncbi:MAG: hypothetical protein IKH81_04135 [Clostridia bacterium]|nr:hypothetical protein [Clostridia bacterium]
MRNKKICLVLGLLIVSLLLTGCRDRILPFEGRQLVDGQVGTAYETNIATGTADMYYDLDYDSSLPRGMILYDDGVIKGVPEQAGTFDFKAVMIDLDDNEYYADFALYIEPGKLEYSGSALADGTTGEPYQQALNTATGSGDITYTVKDGTALPTGLILSEDGVLSGIPEEAGENISVTVTASAPGCNPADAAFSLNIAQGAAAEENLGHIEFAKFDLPDAVVGQPYSESVRKAYGVPNITYSFRFSGGQGLPAGLDRDKDLGLVLGTPVDSTDGKITFRVTAEAEGYDAVTVKVTLNVVDPYAAATRFETEYVNTIPKLTGNGYSDSKTGRGMIQNTPKASNGRMLGYMNKPTDVTFTITAAEETTADLVLGLGSEVGDYTYDPSMFGIIVNGTEIDYGTLNVKQTGENEATFESTPIPVSPAIQLKKGENTITFSIRQSDKATGTFSAVGCLFDYIELNNANCELGWYPRTGNLQ